MSMRIRVRQGLWVVAFAALAACREAEPPIGALAASPASFELGWPEFAEIELVFEPLEPLPTGAAPIVFVHLLDEPGSVVRTFDHALQGVWQPGRRLTHRVRIHQSALGEPLDAGSYLLSAGLYRPEQGRFALRTPAEAVSKLEYRIATVQVAPPAEGTPNARFSEHWLPPEPGADRQVLARRTLRGGAPGTIQFGPVEGAGRLFLGLLVPTPDEPGSHLELLDGGAQPKVRIASSCGGGQPEISGTGRLDVDLEVPPAPGARICEVSIEPNFQVTGAESAEATSVRLEVLAWGPAGDGPDGPEGTDAEAR
jgi:hypothetical protein